MAMQRISTQNSRTEMELWPMQNAETAVDNSCISETCSWSNNTSKHDEPHFRALIVIPNYLYSVDKERGNNNSMCGREKSLRYKTGFSVCVEVGANAGTGLLWYIFLTEDKIKVCHKCVLPAEYVIIDVAPSTDSEVVVLAECRSIGPFSYVLLVISIACNGSGTIEHKIDVSTLSKHRHSIHRIEVRDHYLHILIEHDNINCAVYTLNLVEVSRHSATPPWLFRYKAPAIYCLAENVPFAWKRGAIAVPQILSCTDSLVHYFYQPFPRNGSLSIPSEMSRICLYCIHPSKIAYFPC